MSDYDVTKDRFDEFDREFCERGHEEKCEVTSIIDWFDEEPNSPFINQMWELQGKLHRKFGPAVTHFDPETGNAFRKEWWENGVRHRDLGPAILIRDRNTGELLHEEYYIRGEKVGPSKGAGPQIELK